MFIGMTSAFTEGVLAGSDLGIVHPLSKVCILLSAL